MVTRCHSRIFVPRQWGNDVHIGCEELRFELAVRVVIRYPLESPDPDSFEFYFARTDESGRELIGPTEDQIDFKAQVGPRIFRARFKPAKMRDQQGPDL